MMLDGLDAEGRGDMGLARAGPADQHDVVGSVDEVATVKLADEGLVDLAGGKIEAGEVLVGGEAGRLGLVGDRTHLSLGRLGLQQLGQDRHGRIEGRGTLLDEVADGLGHAVHLEAAQHDHDGGAGGIMTHGRSPCCAAHRSARRWLWVHAAGSGPGEHRSSVGCRPCRRSAGEGC